ncbi:MAG: Unknown protein [uncultured Aureispira sp.]|uniref:DUF2786 domain-containing protein n=1 Tax=uncultured Aureispira sp. TaxID=1331704 RepID=A0A6S6S9P3_9BACT|nr:MAG: Unknown protein [uncultured Aureispira sp.]
MKDTLTSIIAAIKILKTENPDSPAIGILEDSVKTLCKQYTMDLSAMSSVIEFEEVKKELENGLKLLGIISNSAANK